MNFNKPVCDQLLEAGWDRTTASLLAQWYFVEYWWDIWDIR